MVPSSEKLGLIWKVMLVSMPVSSPLFVPLLPSRSPEYTQGTGKKMKKHPDVCGTPLLLTVCNWFVKVIFEPEFNAQPVADVRVTSPWEEIENLSIPLVPLELSAVNVNPVRAELETVAVPFIAELSSPQFEFVSMFDSVAVETSCDVVTVRSYVT